MNRTRDTNDDSPTVMITQHCYHAHAVSGRLPYLIYQCASCSTVEKTRYDIDRPICDIFVIIVIYRPILAENKHILHKPLTRLSLGKMTDSTLCTEGY